MTNLYVGNLSFTCTEDDLEELFGEIGEVREVTIVTNRQTGRSKGYGFVAMPCRRAADAAIDMLAGTQFQGRTLRVSVARPQPEAREQASNDRGRHRYRHPA